jgi:hypothetical protein
MVLCDKEQHAFCTECCWRCCQSSLSDGLVPACPFDKQSRCGAVSKEKAVAALNGWLANETHARKAALSGWSVRGSGSGAGGYSSGKLDAVFESAERARVGAVQCIGKGCDAWYVPPVPHAPERPQRIVCTRPSCRASFCSACRQPFHCRTSCSEALRLNAKWVKVRRAGRGPSCWPAPLDVLDACSRRRACV